MSQLVCIIAVSGATRKSKPLRVCKDFVKVIERRGMLREKVKVGILP